MNYTHTQTHTHTHRGTFKVTHTLSLSLTHTQTQGCEGNRRDGAVIKIVEHPASLYSCSLFQSVDHPAYLYSCSLFFRRMPVVRGSSAVGGPWRGGVAEGGGRGGEGGGEGEERVVGVACGGFHTVRCKSSEKSSIQKTEKSPTWKTEMSSILRTEKSSIYGAKVLKSPLYKCPCIVNILGH